MLCQPKIGGASQFHSHITTTLKSAKAAIAINAICNPRNIRFPLIVERLIVS